MEICVEGRSLVKKISNISVINNIHLQIQKGECFGVVGPAHSGKTSLMKILYGRSPSSTGDLYVLGLNIKHHLFRVKSKIGVVPQESVLDEGFSVMENLLMFSQYFKQSRKKSILKIRALIRVFGMEDEANKIIYTLDRETCRKIIFIRAILTDPEILFVEESELENSPEMTQWIYKFLDDFKSQGRTIVISTRNYETVENLCDRVLLLSHGNPIGEGSPRELISKVIGKKVMEFSIDSHEIKYYEDRIRSKYDYLIKNNTFYLYIREGQSIENALSVMSSDRISVRPPNIGDVYLKYAGQVL